MPASLLVLDPFLQGGWGSAKSALYNELARDWRVDVVGCPFPRRRLMALRLLTFNWRRQIWRLRYYDRLAAYGLSRSCFRWRSRRFQREVRRRMDRFDAVFQVGLVFGIGDLASAKPLFTYHDSTMATAWRNWRPWAPFSTEERFAAYKALERGVLCSVTKALTYSSYARGSLIEDYGMSPDRVVCVGSAIKLAEMPPAHEPEYDGRTLFFVATDFYRKGGEELLMAFDRLRRKRPSARLLIAGILPPIDWRAHPGVEAIGVVSGRREMVNCYRSASLLVHPARYDPFPSVVLEAMSCGLPVVATSVCGIPDQIEDGVTGRLVPPGDPDALADAMDAALGDAAALRRMGQLARERTWERFSAEAVARRIGEQIKAGLA